MELTKLKAKCFFLFSKEIFLFESILEFVFDIIEKIIQEDGFWTDFFFKYKKSSAKFASKKHKNLPIPSQDA